VSVLKVEVKYLLFKEAERILTSLLKGEFNEDQDKKEEVTELLLKD